MLRRLSRVLSKTFVQTMVLLFLFGVGLFFLAQIIGLSGRVPGAAPIGTVAARYRQFATTGS